MYQKYGDVMESPTVQKALMKSDASRGCALRLGNSNVRMANVSIQSIVAMVMTIVEMALMKKAVVCICLLRGKSGSCFF